ncbi:MAG: substrate-binding domain-containing protein [Bryobacteraceae bacterium]|nr:substrate-binding domain-containing protein [Bryobacteraceae bacterium]
MFRYRCALILPTAAFLLLSLASCGGDDYRKQEMYYLVAANTSLPYWQQARAGLLRAAAEVGVSAEMVGPETYDTNAEKEEFLKLIHAEKKPAGILVSAADAHLMKDAIDQAIGMGINTITIDSDSPESKRLFFVGSANYDVGVESANYTVKKLNRAGTVIVYAISGQTNIEDRLRGYRDVFVNYPAVKIIETVDIKGQATIAFDRTKEMIAKDRTRMDAFVCLEAIACAEVAEVLSRNNIKDKVIIAMDAGDRTLDWIQRGLIQATVAQRPYTMAYVGARMLADLHRYPPAKMAAGSTLATVPEFVNIGSVLIDKSNVERFIKDQSEVPGGTGESQP